MLSGRGECGQSISAPSGSIDIETWSLSDLSRGILPREANGPNIKHTNEWWTLFLVKMYQDKQQLIIGKKIPCAKKAWYLTQRKIRKASGGTKFNQNIHLRIKHFCLWDFNENLWDLIDPDSDRKRGKAAPISPKSRTQLFLGWEKCQVVFVFIFMKVRP